MITSFSVVGSVDRASIFYFGHVIMCIFMRQTVDCRYALKLSGALVHMRYFFAAKHPAELHRLVEKKLVSQRIQY